MKKLTRLESQVIGAIFSKYVADNLTLVNLLDQLQVQDRQFSPDSLDSAKSCGFYVDFECSDVLSRMNFTADFPSIQATHSHLTVGADFILFLQSNSECGFLEATFHGESLPTAMLLSANHGVVIGG